ncbi:Uncharacterised protein [uncultured archaeon]|nr:Uncharacterised protein [uncultured archaeon]
MNDFLHLAVFHESSQVIQNSLSQVEYIYRMNPAIRKRQLS